MKNYLSKSILLWIIFIWCPIGVFGEIGFDLQRQNYFINKSNLETMSLIMVNPDNSQGSIPEIAQNPYISARKASGKLFMVSYISTVAIAYGLFKSPYVQIYIPVIGPYLALANPDYNMDSTHRGLLWLSGISQSLTSVMYVIFKVSADDWEYKHQNLKIGINFHNPGVYVSLKF